MNGEYAYAIPAEEAVSPESLNFKEYIQYKMKGVGGKNGRRCITASDLAESLGMSTKVFLEILNGRRSGPDRRDFVIALCAELGLDAGETDEALSLFPTLLRPLSEADLRDREIIRVLNADFDQEISCAALDEQLRSQKLPPLKIRYRQIPNEEGRTGMNKKKINWGLRSEEERQRYNYYTSLNFDDRTATVLALYTYGDKEVPRFSIADAYEAFVNGEEYPPPPPRPPMVMAERAALGGGAVPCFRPGPGASAPKARGRIGSLRRKESVLPEPDEEGVCFSVAEEGNDLYSMSESAIAPCMALDLDVMALTLGDMDTDEYQPIEEKNFRNTMREFSSTFRMTTNTASVGILFNQLRNRRPIDRSMVRIEEMLNYFRYKEEKPQEEMFRISTELKDRENGNKLLYIHVQGKEEIREKQNITVLLDVSGSMTGNAVQTQAAVATVISKLKKGDVFSLVTYSSEDHVVLDGVTVASEKDIGCFAEKLLGLEISGGTYGSAGIEKAYQIGKRNYRPGGNNQIILITDGDLNFGITSQGGLEKLIEEKKKDHLFLSVIGTGLENYKDNKLETLSKHGNGVYRVVNNLNDVKKSIRDEYASLVNVIAKDVKAQVEFNPETVESFRLLGFENRELRHEEFTDDTVISEPFGSGGYGVALYELAMREPLSVSCADSSPQGEPRIACGRDLIRPSVSTGAPSPEGKAFPEEGRPVVQENRYTRVVTTGSKDLGTVKIRYKEPLEEVSHEIEQVIRDTEERYTDNLLLAGAVFVGAEKLRDSEMIEARDEALALADLERLGTEIKVLNLDDLEKLRAILIRSKEQLGIRNLRLDEDIW